MSWTLDLIRPKMLGVGALLRLRGIYRSLMSWAHTCNARAKHAAILHNGE